jgi:carbamoyltransferase
MRQSVRKWFKLFTSVTETEDVFEKRVIIGYFIQKVLELYFTQLLSDNNIRNVMLAGGVFYNVKLNNSIKRDLGRGMICVMPLAGDQGCGVGMYRHFHGSIKIKTLNIGLRDLKTDWNHPRGLVCLTEYSLKECLVNLLKQDKIVNVVRGNMEFGPRALGNTSTFALPTEKNVQYINTLNERSTIMPMAPVVRASKADKYFHYDYVIGSLKYMIMTLDHLEKPDESILGICHKYPMEDKWSSRAQIIDKDNIISDVLDEVGVDFLINTSYNFHGLPIVYDVDGAIKTFEMQNKLDTEERNYLIIGAY